MTLHKLTKEVLRLAARHYQLETVTDETMENREKRKQWLEVHSGFIQVVAEIRQLNKDLVLGPTLEKLLAAYDLLEKARVAMERERKKRNGPVQHDPKRRAVLQHDGLERPKEESLPETKQSRPGKHTGSALILLGGLWLVKSLVASAG